MEFWTITAIAVLAGAFISFLIGQAIGKRTTPTQPDAADGHLSVEIARLQERERNLNQELSRLGDAARTMTAQLSSLQTEHAGTREKLAAAEERAANFQSALANEKEGSAARIARAEGYIGERENRITTLQDVLDETRAKLTAKESELAAAGERESALNRTLAERDEQLTGLHQKLKAEFENIANSVLQTTSNQLSERSHASLSAILDPLKARIVEFQQKVEDTHLDDTSQRAALREQIKAVSQTNQTLGMQADALTKALKGDSQIRGRWGEVRLERILEMSGLQRDREFVIQGGDFNIKSEDGGSQRPDIIVLLPEQRHFVIDSKVSLIDYLDYERAETEDSRAAALKKVLASCRTHIDELAGKKYQFADAINSHDLVFMFMPIEGVAALALHSDDTLFEYAWNRRIVIASPSTLFMAMQTVHSIWRYERQNQNAQKIAEQAGRLYDKLSSFVEDLNDVSSKIAGAAAAHNEAMKKLVSGRGNALASAQKFKSLGVATKKNIPSILIDGERHIADESDDEE